MAGDAQMICLFHLDNRRASFGGEAQQLLLSFRILRGYDHRHRGFDDAAFFEGDFRQRAAQNGGVVVRNWGNNGDQRAQDIGRVQPAAKPNFHNGDVHLALLKVEKCQRGHQFEGGDIRHLLRERTNTGDQVYESLARNLLAVNLDALGKFLQMGGGIQPGFIPRGA